VSSPQILGIGTANPPIRLTQEQCFQAAGYASERVRRIFLNSDIEHRHFYFGSTLNRGESSDQLNERYLSGAMKTGCHAIVSCLQSARANVKEVDFLAVCSCTGYVCPDVGSRLIAHMGFSKNVQRASIIGLGCAGAVPTLQRAADFVRANPGRKALMLAVEICSACYYVDNTSETVIGNVCADAAAFCSAQRRKQIADTEIVDFEFPRDRANQRSWTSTPVWQIANRARGISPASRWPHDRKALQQLLLRQWPSYRIFASGGSSRRP
jgi:predicted naringenin-chalcone synthase